MKVSLIVAMDENRVIGKENDIPWRIPRDWEYVKKITLGHPIIFLGEKLPIHWKNIKKQKEYRLI